MGRDSGTSWDKELYRRQLSWLLFFRVLIISLFLGGTILYQFYSGIGKDSVSLYLYLLVGLCYLQTLVSAFVLPRLHRLRLFTRTQIVWDLLFCTSLIYVTGGIESIFSFLFIFIITSAGVYLTRKEVLFVASASAILYGGLLNLQFYGYLPLIDGLAFPQQIDGRNAFYTVFVNVVAFFLTAFLSSSLSERLRKSKQDLEKREVDYEELENLNRTILTNITSGLMIINPMGRIRLFNDAATKITGFPLEEVYNRDIREVFPKIQTFNGDDFTIVRRGEGFFLDQNGCLKTLGYTSSLVRDPQGKTLGFLVAFQDLTHLKEMEEQLNRADRLAAVGRLASGMAHEIRNPLASISGSVQLLMDGSHVSDEDRRLMEIVVKEADRLSNLLTDFLIFARPTPPKPVEVDVSALLDELADILIADPRFSGIKILREYPSGARMHLDRQKFHQALWNLAINGAEAMASRGVLTLGIDPDASAVYVEDSGPGISEDIRDKIFDPFFTTKDRGTGLGLATVYAIVEAHGGEIELASGAKGGIRFTIRLHGKAVRSDE
jgi:two-component system sensor histidine kinase PilS (NtrC family)